MEFGVSTSMKEPRALYKQVEAQSPLCDVTIQVGQWKKKYHWCVLVKSPFFECIARSDFKEKQTGLVKLEFATPVATEAAIMFLYGRRPKPTMDNAAEILELAEFLLIPSLKSRCIAFLKNVAITNENCLKMLQISSLYDFEFSQCYDYIRANLPEILRKEEATFLTKESVMTLLTDPLLSYVLAEDKFEFAIRWARANQLNRDAFEDIFKAIDIESMDGEFLETVVLQNPFVTEMRIATPNLHVRTPLGDHRALIFPELLKNDKIVCFDIESERWSGIEADLLKCSIMHGRRSLLTTVGVCRPREVYILENRFGSYKIYLQDLRSKERTTKTVTTSDNTHTNCFSIYDLSRDIFVAISNERIEMHISTKKHKSTVRRLVDVDTATVYCGQLQHQDTRIYPIFTIRNTDVAAVCINEHNVIALLSKKRDILHLYDISSCQFDTVALNDHIDIESVINYGLRVAAKEDGFVLYNKEIVLDISRLNDPDLTERYAVQSTRLENHRKWDRCIYNFSSNIWFRILRKKCLGDIEFSCVNHDVLMNASSEQVTWNQLPPPPEGDKLLYRVIIDAFIVELPKSMLRCHLDCPHCPRPEKQRMKWLDDERLPNPLLAKTSAMDLDHYHGAYGFHHAFDFPDIYDYDALDDYHPKNQDFF